MYKHEWLWFSSPLFRAATSLSLHRHMKMSRSPPRSLPKTTIFRASLIRRFHSSSTTFTRLTDLHSFSSTSSRARPCQSKDWIFFFWKQKLPILFCAFLAGWPCNTHTHHYFCILPSSRQSIWTHPRKCRKSVFCGTCFRKHSQGGQQEHTQAGDQGQRVARKPHRYPKFFWNPIWFLVRRDELSKSVS